MFRAQSQSCPPLETAKILGLRYPYRDRGGAKIVKLNENFKIVAVSLTEDRYGCNASAVATVEATEAAALPNSVKILTGAIIISVIKITIVGVRRSA